MVGYTQFSSRSEAKLWDPCKTLGIINSDTGGLTCNGYAPSEGRRCRNPIQADNRTLIMRTLEDIAYLPPDSPAVVSKLRSIAGPALCVRNHQGQAGEVVMKWQGEIQHLKPKTRERKPTRLIQSGKSQQLAQDPSVKDLYDQLKELNEAVAKLKEDIVNQRHKSPNCEGQEERAERHSQEEREQRRSEWRYRDARRVTGECLEKERLEKERLKKERLEKERLEKERLEEERLEEERLEKERLEKERLDKERLERERLERERLAREKAEYEERQRKAREEAAAQNERIRQRAQKRQEENEKEKREKERKEREDERKNREKWDQLWARYQERWAQFQASASHPKEGNIRDAIPWPVESSSYRDATASTVEDFFKDALSKDECRVKLLRKECMKWHPDSRRIWLGNIQLSDADKMVIDMICRVVTKLVDAAKRSA